MFSWISFFQKRPSDNQIRIFRVVFGLALLSLVGLSYGHTAFGTNQNPQVTIALFALLGLIGALPLVSGATGACFLKRKQMKKVQMTLGLLLIVIGSQMNPILPKEATPTPTAQSGSEVSFDELTKKSEKPATPFVGGGMIAFLGFIFFVAGLSGKTITSNCLKHGEKITKIRV